MMLVSFLSYGGMVSCTVGGLLALLGVANGRQARQLGAAVQVNSLADLKQLWALVPVVVAVTGRVLAPRPYTCDISGTEAAIIEMREEKVVERKVGGYWVREPQLQRESVREAEWALRDGSAVELPVEAGRRAAGDFLQTAGDRLIPEETTTSLLRSVVNEVQGVRGVGVRQVERVLPVGAMLTAVGELAPAVEHPSAFQNAPRRDGRMLVLRAPHGGPFYLSRRPLPEVVASLQASSVACYQWGAALTALGASMLVAAATQHALAWLRQRRLRLRVEKARRERAEAAAAAAAAGRPAPAHAAGAADAGGDEAEHRPALCVVCLDRGCDTVFPSCGHMCACSGCASNLARCPVCRSRGPPIRVYTP